MSGVSTQYIGAHFEKEGSLTRKYYTAGAVRVAVRDTTGVSFLLSDHLGSTSLALRVDSSYVVSSESEQRYSAWGETRDPSGTMPTRRGYTGQYSEPSLGILFYNARWMDPLIGRFISADTIIPEPGNPIAWDRYAYTSNNPLQWT